MAKTSAIRVRTRFESIDDFVVGYSPFFDAKGIFIRTRRVQEVGTRMRFELQLSDGEAVFRGEGTVDEVREPPLSASGMHLRISRLDRTSKELFERITSDTDYISEDPFEAPTYDPDKPNVVMAGAAARVIAAASRGSQVVRGGQPERRRGSATAPTDAPKTDGRTAAAPTAAVVEAPPKAEGGALDASVLDEIADGIELSLDAVWSAADGQAGGAADLAGYFGSPQDLVQAGPSIGEPPQGSEPAEQEPAPSPAFDSAPPSQPEAAEPAETLGLGPEDPFYLSSPGGADVEAAGLEFLDDDEFESDDAIIEGEPVEASEHGEPDVVASSDIFASGDYDLASSLDGDELLAVPMEMETLGADDLDNELGIDHSLALASAYDPASDAEELDDDDLFLETDEVVEPDADELIEFVEPGPPEPKPPGPVRAGPDLESLASATLEHAPVDKQATYRRYSFGTDEQPALGNLISDLFDDEIDARPTLDIAIFTGEHDVPDEGEGPDAIDELLARESANEEKEAKKTGLLGRLFGRKKKKK